jgi:hypothetical protein
MRGLLLELSDQSAYRRYLEGRGRSHSTEEWQRFTETRYRRKFGNAKCC